MAISPANPIAKSSSILEEVERFFGKQYHEEASFDLSKLSPDRRIQSRESAHFAPKEEVERYAIQMAENVFPPIVVTSDNWLLDGNTRVGASLKRKQNFYPAVVLDLVYDGAKPEQQTDLELLSYTLNMKNGRSLTPKEQRDRVGRFLSRGWTTQKIGRSLGVAPATIGAVHREIRAAERTANLGLHLNGSMKDAPLRALGNEIVMNLNDAPYKELTTLAIQAGLNAKEITTFAKETKALGADEAAMARLQQIREEMGERIRERELTGVGKPPVARQLRQHLGFVRKYLGNEGALVETNVAMQGAHLEAIDEAIAVLQNIRKAQAART